MKLLLLLTILSVSASFGALTISTVTVNPAGQLVLTIAGCTAPLSPSTGVTDLIVANATDSNAAFIQSTSTSGCTVTIVTQADASTFYPTMQDDGTSGVSVNLLSSSNLRDSVGNYPSGNLVTVSTNSSEWYAVGGSLISSVCRFDGGPSIITLPSHGLQWIGAGANIRCQLTTSEVDLLTFNFNQIWAFSRDGTQVGSLLSTPSYTNFTSYPFSGLSGTHIYEWMQVNPGVFENNTIAVALRIYGGLGSGPLPPVKPWLLFFGSGEAEFLYYSDIRNSQSWILGNTFGLAEQNEGRAGDPLTGGDIALHSLRELMKASINALVNGSDPKYLIISEGGNDILQGKTIGTDFVTPDTFKGDAVTLLQEAATRFPTTNVLIAQDIYNTPVLRSIGTGQTYSDAWRDAVAYYNAHSPAIPAVYIGLFGQGCTDDSVAFQTDNMTLNPVGELTVANCEIPVWSGLIDGHSYTTTGISGSVGVASAPVTVTLARGAKFSTAHSCTLCQSVILNDGGAGGTFTITAGGSGSGASPLTVTPTDQATAFSFTYTPVSSGAKTISFTNNLTSWIDAPPISYTPGGSSATSTTLSGVVGMFGKVSVQ